VVSGLGMNGRQLLALLNRPVTDRAAGNDNAIRSVEPATDLFGEEQVEQHSDARKKPNRRKRRRGHFG
jgi:hypothetical protein